MPGGRGREIKRPFDMICLIPCTVDKWKLSNNDVMGNWLLVMTDFKHTFL